MRGASDVSEAVSRTGGLERPWIHGTLSRSRQPDPPLEIRAPAPDTFVLRQSKQLSYEAPFLYLLVGERRALLIDTGATAEPERFPLRAAIERIIAERFGGRAPLEYGLVVAHSHSHGDHIAADPQFEERANTTVVGTRLEDVRGFFDLGSDLDRIVPFDLGSRTLEVFAIPGHHPTSISVYDPQTGFLLTGDTVYPGRLYVGDPEAFVGSLDRLVRFAGTRPVSCALGGHIEMTRTPRRDYPIGTRYQPDEAPLPMTVERLVAVRDAAASVARTPGAHFFDDFAIFSGPCTGAVFRQLARSAWTNLVSRRSSRGSARGG